MRRLIHAFIVVAALVSAQPAFADCVGQVQYAWIGTDGSVNLALKNVTNLTTSYCNAAYNVDSYLYFTIPAAALNAKGAYAAALAASLSGGTVWVQNAGLASPNLYNAGRVISVSQ